MLRRFWALTGRWWRRSGGLAVAIAATPAAWAVVAAVAGLSTSQFNVRGWVGIVVPAVLLCVVVGILTGLIGAVRTAARKRGVTAPGAVATVLVLVQAAVMVLLDHLVPFRLGLVSVLLHYAPAVLMAHGAMAGIRRVYIACAVTAAVVIALAVGLLQQAAGGWEWTHMGGVPSRTWLQVISLPRMTQEPYQWDARSRTLTADFNQSDGIYGDGALRMVIPDQSAPPTIWTSEQGHPNTSCRTWKRPGSWECVDPGVSGVAGYVLRSGPVMIILSGFAWEGLPDAILAAHPASNAELWSRSGLMPRTVIGWLLL
jgi:hypothetical protein